MESNDVGGYLRTDGLGRPRGASVKLMQRYRENQEEDKEAGGFAWRGGEGRLHPPMLLT